MLFQYINDVDTDDTIEAGSCDALAGRPGLGHALSCPVDCATDPPASW